MRPPHRHRATALLATLALLLVAAGCSDDDAAAPGPDAPPGSTADDPTSTTDPGDAAAPEQYTGPDDGFYEVPDPLPPGEPGQLIRVMDLGEADGARTLRVMYHSRDAQDRDRAVTGIVTHPTTEAPEGGWPVVSWAHGTSGLAAPCAPSRQGQPAPGFGIQGVHVATDYIGLGPVGELHPYLSKPSEGHSVIDAVRAARLLPDAHAGDRWLAIGHSQGGHAAMAAHELAGDYGPELELLGTVALAPGAMFEEVYGGIDPIVTGIVTALGLVGASDEYPEVDPADYFTPEAAAAAETIRTGCLDEITEAFLGVGFESLFEDDPRTTEPAASLILANDVGSVAVDDVPLFLVSGTIDDRVVIDRVRALFDRLCGAGQVTELLVIEGADHGSIIPQTSEQTTAWMEARLAEDEPVDSCAEAAG